MRTMARNLAWIGLVGAGAAVYIGCGTAYDDFYVELTNPKYASGSSSGTSSSSTTSGSSSGTGGMAPDCTGDPSETNVIDACGVFVQADAAGATEDGTQAHPYKTLQKAIDNAGSKRVYACDSTPYAESLTVAAPVEIYGGFDCAKGWGWTATGRSVLNGPEGAVTLTLTKQADGSKVQGFSITAASAGVGTKGESSIGVAVDDIAATLISCEVTAGDATAGEDGVTPADVVTNGANAPLPDAMTMNACINPASLVGGPAAMTTCDDGVSAGGVGGKGGITGTDSGDGQMGTDGTPPDATKGKGGAGQTIIDVCAVGVAGKDGDSGADGAAGISPGALSLSGVASTEDTDGKSGSKAQGGGGGGGAKSGVFCAGAVDGNGASGGGGGAGGCGGKGGGGGKAGGSSIAILSLGTKLALTEVSLKTGKGGDGGKGAIGQSGGDPGLGATGGAKSGIGASKPGCKGGDGGLGGLGGPGGGGRGGHSVGIAYVNAPSKAPVLKGFTGDTEGSGGTAGPGNVMGDGAQGAKGACWDFTMNLACAK